MSLARKLSRKLDRAASAWDRRITKAIIRHTWHEDEGERERLLNTTDVTFSDNDRTCTLTRDGVVLQRLKLLA